MFFGTSPSRALSRVAGSTLSDVNNKSMPARVSIGDVKAKA